MANPGYPMQPPPSMGGMPMGPGMPGPGPMPGPGMMRPMRRGTSRAVPVVVSAGLAIGVFCGLLFGLGTGGDEAKAQTTTETKKDQGSSAETPGVLVAKPSTEVPKPIIDGSGSGGSADAGSAAVAAGSAGSADAGSAAGSAAAAPKSVKLIIALKPEAAAQAAKITVDGKDVEATSDIELGDAPKKKVSIYIKANGFKDYTYEGEIEAGKDTKFEFEMQKKPVIRPSGGNLPRPETGGGKKPTGGGKKPGGGLIDI